MILTTPELFEKTEVPAAGSSKNMCPGNRRFPTRPMILGGLNLKAEYSIEQSDL